MADEGVIDNELWFGIEYMITVVRGVQPDYY